MKVVVVAGPTATGKSEIAVRLAQRWGECEIVSADSMQVYREMNIGTAKPGPELTGCVPHHLLDIIDPSENFSAAEFQVLAREAMAKIASKGRMPILTGGSGLYVRAALDQLDFPALAPGSDRRVELERMAATDMPALIEILRSLDPEAVDLVETANARRVIRAIEAVEETGLPFIQRNREWDQHRSVFDPLILGLRMPRERLIRRIEVRVDRMVADGLIEETRALLARDRPLSTTAAQALGYKELFSYLQGDQSLEDAVELIKIRTRQFAKRQMTWFKRDPRVNWIDVDSDDPESAVERILTLVSEKQFIV